MVKLKAAMKKKKMETRKLKKNRASDLLGVGTAEGASTAKRLHLV